MNNTKNRTGVLRQLTALQNLKLPELQEKWRDLYGTEPPHFKSTFLKKRLAFRIQELFYGGISGEVKAQIDKIAASDPLCVNIELQKTQDRQPKGNKVLPGTRFIREWQDRQYEVIAREDGFEFNGKIFRSLSAVATEITGTKWNGKLFFGLTKRRS